MKSFNIILYVGNFSREVTVVGLWQEFQALKEVASVNNVTDKYCERPGGILAR